jgi:hypothetical protein
MFALILALIATSSLPVTPDLYPHPSSSPHPHQLRRRALARPCPLEATAPPAGPGRASCCSRTRRTAAMRRQPPATPSRHSACRTMRRTAARTRRALLKRRRRRRLLCRNCRRGRACQTTTPLPGQRRRSQVPCRNCRRGRACRSTTPLPGRRRRSQVPCRNWSSAACFTRLRQSPAVRVGRRRRGRTLGRRRSSARRGPRNGAPGSWRRWGYRATRRPGSEDTAPTDT